MKTIILYSSKYGTTKMCANQIKSSLDQSDIFSLDQNKYVDVSEYDRVVFGSSVYMGRMRSAVSKFISNNADDLKGKEVNFFFCCNDSTDYKGLVPNVVKTSVNEIRHFGFELKISEMGLIDKFITKKVSGSKADLSKVNDKEIESYIEYLNKEV